MDLISVTEVLALQDMFDCIVTADRITRGKPDPMCFLLGASDLGKSPKECLVFEDSFAGIQAGLDAGMQVIALSTTNPKTLLQEKVKFVLAAYNGGYYHVRDAMALARKYGKNPFLWEDVSFFIRGLSSERYYRDPIVKYGYMIGSETSDYVASVVERWRMYGGQVSSIRGEVPSAGREPGRARRENRFTRGTKIYGPDDPEFTQTEKN